MSKDNVNVDENLKKAIRLAKVNKLIQAVFLIVLGLALVIWSGTAILVICRVISAIIAVCGLAIVVAFLLGRNRYYGTSLGLFGGVFSAVLGMYLFNNPAILASLGPTIIGLMIIVTGIVDLTEALRIEKQRSGGTVVAMAIAAVELIVGVIFILHPAEINNVLFVLMGLTLILDGAADIWLLFQIGRPEKVVTPAEPGGEVIDGQTRPLGEDSAAAQEQSFVDRAKARAAARRQEREEKKAAQAAAAAAAQTQTQSDPAPEEGYTTIPHVKDAEVVSDSDAGTEETKG